MNDPDVFLDSDIEALEESIRAHPAKGFQRPRWTAHCSGCGRGLPAAALEVAHYAPGSKPLCASCRKNWARWHRTASQLAAARTARDKRRELGLETKRGFPVD